MVRQTSLRLLQALSVSITTLISASALAVPNPTAQSKKLLQGSVKQDITTQARALGFVVEKNAQGQSVVAQIIRGSSAFYRGLRLGDQVLNINAIEANGALTANVTISRAGQTFALNLATRGDYNHAAENDRTASAITTANSQKESERRGSAIPDRSIVLQTPTPADSADAVATKAVNLQGGTKTDQRATTLSGHTSEDEHRHKQLLEKTFRDRDLVILIDRSGSMETTDCPGASSRWQWCRDQVSDLSKQTECILPKGFSLILFNNHSKSFNAIDVGSIADAFLNNKPDGGTDIAGALNRVLREYLDKRMRDESLKPLVVAVITDGVPNDERSLRRALITATNEITRAEDLSVVFLQVGDDNQASAYLEDLDRGLVHEGARFDITESVVFPEVKREGLLRALIRSVN